MFVAIGRFWGRIVGDLMFLVGEFQDDIVRNVCQCLLLLPGIQHL